ncbi:IPT/TIG domain-containing protein [Spirosoma validum]|uniref:IPT/TIG domain-containing protein n=1 Tax=Spirosoma validum TaxID=2771355 RepID=A0A927B541_9BACT|nr:IPT/TIG domain-containing protein [Spirosoma validum]MBD2755367.1 IPT/TIG domain-containing protein [Spirosoma validum]
MKTQLTIRHIVFSLLVLAELMSGCKKESAPPVTPATLTIRNVSPSSGRGGTVLTLTGENFDPANFSATVNGKAATVVRGSVTTTTAQVEVPANCGTGPVDVITGGKSGRAPNEFEYLFNRFTEMVYYIQDGRLWSMDIFQGRKRGAMASSVLRYDNAEMLLLGRPVTGTDYHRMIIFENNGTGGGGYSDLRDGGGIDGFVSGTYGSGRTGGWLGVQSATASKVRPGSLYFLWNKRDVYDGSFLGLNGTFLQSDQLRTRYGNDMAFVCEAGGVLYVLQTNGTVLSNRITTATGAIQPQSAGNVLSVNFGGFKAVTDLNNALLFIANDGLLYRYALAANTLTKLPPTQGKWNNVKAMTGVGDYLMVVDGEQLYRVDPQTGSSEAVGSERLLIRTNNFAGYHN